MSAAIEQTGARYPLLAKRTSKRWLITAAVTTAIVALPVLSVLILALFPEENIWPHLLETTLPRYLVTTLQARRRAWRSPGWTAASSRAYPGYRAGGGCRRG